MGVTGIDHIYAETADWDATVAFWHGLGFEFTSRWGDEGHRAGRLESGTAAVVVAEIPAGQEPDSSVFFHLDDADSFVPDASVEIVAPLAERSAEGREAAYELDLLAARMFFAANRSCVSTAQCSFPVAASRQATRPWAFM